MKQEPFRFEGLFLVPMSVETASFEARSDYPFDSPIASQSLAMTLAESALVFVRNEVKVLTNTLLK